mmetsp:Transcript_10986/g.11101  ORF Transcript_10986/g.11101 Transcript_10986/m.11101 type:complete len:117 (+) Transcript_10986:146-496(+)
MSNIEEAIKESLGKLKLDYVDCYLIHWPAHYHAVKRPMFELWKELESLVDRGLTKSLGLSNFNVQLIMDILTYAKHLPVVNQVELHPSNAQVELVRFLTDFHIVPVAYCPVGRPGA